MNSRQEFEVFTWFWLSVIGHMEEFVQVRSVFQSVGELDQLREFAAGAELEIMQLGRGKLQGVLVHLDLGPSSIHLNQLSLSARGRGSLSPHRWTFVVFPESVHGNFNCQTLNAANLLAYPPNSEFEGTTESSFHDWALTVDIDDLALEYQRRYGSDLTVLSGGVEALKADPRAVSALRAFTKSTIDQAEVTPGFLDDASVRQQLHSQLLGLLCEALHSAASSSGRHKVRRATKWKLVGRLEQNLWARAHEPTTLQDLAQAADSSERTLRRAITNVIGVGPAAYLRTIRLNHVRRQLEFLPAQGSVSAVAVSCGFHHLGRFAQEYRRFFGELPSETARRSRASQES